MLGLTGRWRWKKLLGHLGPASKGASSGGEPRLLQKRRFPPINLQARGLGQGLTAQTARQERCCLGKGGKAARAGSHKPPLRSRRVPPFPSPGGRSPPPRPAQAHGRRLLLLSPSPAKPGLSGEHAGRSSSTHISFFNLKNEQFPGTAPKLETI